jgi:hypothetical protein
MQCYLTSFWFCRRSRSFSICKYCLIIILLLCSFIYISFKIKILIDYHNAHFYHQILQSKICKKDINQKQEKQKLILFWTKIFSGSINADYINNHLFTPTGRCATNQCRVTIDRQQLCRSDAVIFHARGGINTFDMPKARLPHQRYVLLTKEPPYKTTAIVGHLNYFFNWTATVSIEKKTIRKLNIHLIYS